MGLCVTFVSGPRRSGKSAVIQMMIDKLWARPPHYIRLVRSGSDKHRPRTSASECPKCGVASARWLEYDSDRIFEVLPDALTTIHLEDRFGSVAVEADTDATLRYAYPYDYRVFVMPLPSSLKDVFRDAVHAAAEFERVLVDTQAFATEVFGLFAGGASEDGEPPEDRGDLSGTQMRAFLHSPLGDELATRIQLQQPYHGLVESDVILVNALVGKPTAETNECLRRIERLLDRTRSVSGRRSELFRCDPHDSNPGTRQRLLKALRPMCQGGS